DRSRVAASDPDVSLTATKPIANCKLQNGPGQFAICNLQSFRSESCCEVCAMPTLLIVGGGLFGSQAAAYARSKGIEAVVFDPGTAGAASHAAAGLSSGARGGKKMGARS